MLEVTFLTDKGEKAEVHEDVDYVSLVNNETFGPPPLVAPNREGNTTARVGDQVLYINTNLVPAFTIERISD